MDLPGYDPFYSLPDAERLFRTERGSTYAHFKDQTSQRNRSGEGHSDKTTGIQDRSLKTIYMQPQAVNAVGSWLQNQDVATRLIPILDKDGKQTGRAAVQLTEPMVDRPMKVSGGKFIPTGPERVLPVGHTLAEVSYERSPSKGLHPVEIFNSESPKGNRGTGVHFGSRITEVLERKGGGARGGGGAGIMPDTDITASRKLPNMAKGGGIEMPSEYSVGRWKLI